MGWRAPAFAFGLALGLFLGQAARANFVTVGTPQFGSDSAILDTSTGLEWLNLGFSTGFSANQVLAQEGAGGRFAGFRYATEQEFSNLTREAFGLANICCYVPLPLDTTVDFITLFGSTVPGGIQQSGMFPLIGPPFETMFFTSFFLETAGSGPELVGMYDQNTGGNFNSSFPTRGSWLVRAVPEPTALAVLGIGLTGLVAAKRRRE